MRAIIEDKLYDTDKAEEICSDGYGYSNDFHYWKITLYQTAKGQYFKHGEGGARSEFAVRVGTNSTTYGERLWLVDDAEARAFVEKVDVQKALELFGDHIEEG